MKIHIHLDVLIHGFWAVRYYYFGSSEPEAEFSKSFDKSKQLSLRPLSCPLLLSCHISSHLQTVSQKEAANKAAKPRTPVFVEDAALT